MAYHGSGAISVTEGGGGGDDVAAAGGTASFDGTGLPELVCRIDAGDSARALESAVVAVIEAPFEGRALVLCAPPLPLPLPLPLITSLLPFEVLPVNDDGGFKAVDASQSARGRVAITAAHWRSERPAGLPAERG